MIKLAMDKSVRSFDRDGRLHVAESNISKAAVNEYYGYEIPGYQELGLDANKMYKLLRCPEELKKAAHTFNNIPLLETHVADTADQPATQHRVGTTGSEARFDFPYLKNSLAIWDNESIAGIETDEQRELSGGYHYDIDPTPGIFEGEAYDFRMINIIGNHVALVKEGRAGADVLVGDSAPKLTTESNHMSYDTEAIKSALDKYGMDAETAEQAVAEIVKLLPEIKAEDNDPEEGKDNAPENAEDESENSGQVNSVPANAHIPAQDSKPVQVAFDEAAITQRIQAKVAEEFRELEKAKEAVRPLVGSVMGMDSAKDVYKFALESANINVKGVHPSAYPAMLSMALQSQSNTKHSYAMDSSARSDFDAMFPSASIK